MFSDCYIGLLTGVEMMGVQKTFTTICEGTAPSENMNFYVLKNLIILLWNFSCEQALDATIFIKL